MTEDYPSEYRQEGEKVQELIGSRLLACMNISCRVNEFEVE